MEILFILAVMTLMLGAAMYLLVCIDPNSPGILGKVHRLVFESLPVLLRYVQNNNHLRRKVMGDRLINFFARGANYVFYSNHPLVQFFYALVAVGGFIVYCLYGFLTIFKDNPEVNHWHSIVGITLGLYSFYSYG